MPINKLPKKLDSVSRCGWAVVHWQVSPDWEEEWFTLQSKMLPLEVALASLKTSKYYGLHFYIGYSKNCRISFTQLWNRPVRFLTREDQTFEPDQSLFYSHFSQVAVYYICVTPVYRVTYLKPKPVGFKAEISFPQSKKSLVLFCLLLKFSLRPRLFSHICFKQHSPVGQPCTVHDATNSISGPLFTACLNSVSTCLEGDKTTAVSAVQKRTSTHTSAKGGLSAEFADQIETCIIKGSFFFFCDL